MVKIENYWNINNVINKCFGQLRAKQLLQVVFDQPVNKPFAQSLPRVQCVPPK